MADQVDRVLEQWANVRPDLDASPMGIVGRLSRLSRLIDVRLRETFREHGLDGATFDVLATLRRSGPDQRLTPADLMRSSMITSGAVTQRLDRLEQKGLVARTPHESDGRGVYVTLTDAGRELVDETLPDHLATEEAILAELDDDERARFTGTLRTLLESLEDAHE
ncbi:MAG: MarR family transcriptional regulator [Actinomycetia bacterium]|nr:MarR family transcriptional regulator [Actinomycetes bacterium]